MQLSDPVTCKVEVNNQPFINGIFKSIKCAKGGGGACFILPWLRSHFESCCFFLFSSLHRQEFRCSPPLSGWPQPALRTDANYLELILIILMSWWNLNDFPKFVALPCLWSLASGRIAFVCLNQLNGYLARPFTGTDVQAEEQKHHN